MPVMTTKTAGVVPAHMRDASRDTPPQKQARTNLIVDQAIRSMSPQREGADPILQHKLAVVLRKLHEAVDELNLQESELLAVYAFLDRVGANSDMMLLGDHLGVSMRVNDLTYRRDIGTAANVIGPLYRDNAPIMDNPGEMVPPETKGRHIWLYGQVTDAVSHAPLADTVLDFWQTDHRGLYDYQAADLKDYDFRRRIRTDAEGRFAFRTIVPLAYEIANRDTPVTELMQKLGRRSYRAPHVHVIVTRADYNSLTTLIYFEGEELNGEDCIFSCRPENTIAITRAAEPGQLDQCRFDVQLVPFAR
jgi:hydroxyquinol 1,2-dioxygenase